MEKSISSLKINTESGKGQLLEIARQVIESKIFAQNLQDAVEREINLFLLSPLSNDQIFELVTVIQSELFVLTEALENCNFEYSDGLSFENIVTKGRRKSINNCVREYCQKIGLNNNKTATLLAIMNSVIVPSQFEQSVFELGLTKGCVDKNLGERIHTNKANLKSALSESRQIVFLRNTVELEPEFVERFSKSVASIKLCNPEIRQKRQVEYISLQVQRDLLSLLRADMAANKITVENQENYIKLAQIWSELMSNEKIKLYFLNNTIAISQQILAGLELGAIMLTIPTCPDYSGYYTEENGKKTFHFDFNGLGSGENGKITTGSVSKKGFDLVDEVSTALQKHIPVVDVLHILPTWEFDDGGFQGLTKDDTTNMLMVQANLIQSEYNDRGINATVGLSDLVVSDLEFWGRRDALAKDIFLSSQTSQLQDQYLSFVLKNRKSLYEKWFSKKDGETEQDWSLRIKQEVIPKSLADYLLLGQIYEEKNLPHIGLDCSSSVTCGVYEKRLFSQQGYAVIHGRTSSSEVSGYEGD